MGDKHKAAAEDLEQALYEFLCAVEDIEPRLHPDLEVCVTGATWGLRGTVGEELKALGIDLRFPKLRKPAERRRSPFYREEN